MRIEQAIELISGVEEINKPKQQWADLGCGDGLFTVAIATLLGKDSIIHAVDSNQKSLSNIPDSKNTVLIEKHKLDFVIKPLPFDSLDGVLMANSFHFVKDKVAFIFKIKNHLKASHKLILIEYDMDSPNKWVPYPISFKKLERFFKEFNYHSIDKLHETLSIYNRANIYSALVKT